VDIKRLAAIDIGSNAIRLLISNVIESDREPLFKKASLIRIPVRLGEDVFENRLISERNIVRIEHTMHAFRHIMIVNGVVDYRACATSAMRESLNGREVIDRVGKNTGINIEIIDGGDEADIIFSTHVEQIIEPSAAYLFVDVGGGSTEITLLSQGQKSLSRSFDIGTIRILKNQVTIEQWAEMGAWVQEITQSYPSISLIGSGGNINKIFKMSGKKIGSFMTYRYLRDYLHYLKEFSVEDRVRLLDLNIDRADVIVPAASIYVYVMQKCKAQRIYVPKVGLSDGIVRSIYGRKRKEVLVL
jgi:exopolyphosphatase/guanosine-5'-triphosphate,3'-diphosphate pyrophosphatase